MNDKQDPNMDPVLFRFGFTAEFSMRDLLGAKVCIPLFFKTSPGKDLSKSPKSTSCALLFREETSLDFFRIPHV